MSRVGIALVKKSFKFLRSLCLLFVFQSVYNVHKMNGKENFKQERQQPSESGDALGDRYRFQTTSTEASGSGTVVESSDSDANIRSQCVASVRRNYVTDNGASSGPLNMSILFVGLLEVILAKVESNKAVRETLLKVILEKLQESKIFPNVSEVLDDLKPLRRHYLKGFWRIIQEARKNITTIVPLGGAQSSAIDLQTLSLPCPKDWFTDYLNASRYESNFEELGVLGKGGFGIVYRARNRVDLTHYAVKKIFLKDVKHEGKLKIMREARVLATLKHPNIVCYHGAWMEFVAKLPGCFAGISRNTNLSSEVESSSALCSSNKKNKTSATTSTSNGNANDSNVSDESEGGIVFGTEPASAIETIQIDQIKTDMKLEVIEITSESDCESSSIPSEVLRKYSQPLETRQATENQSNGGAGSTFKSSLHGRYRSSPSFSRSFSCPNSVDLDKVDKPADTNCLEVAALRYSSSQEISGCFALFIQMELYDASLKQWVNQRNVRAAESKSSWSFVEHKSNLHIFKQITSALSYIHSKNVVHRDLKLQNIFIDPKSLHIWVGDYGLARHIDESFEDNSEETKAEGEILLKSETKVLGLSDGIGSYPYVAPELLNGKGSYTSKVDMFSLGIVLFELYNPFSTSMERARVIEQLKKTGKVPDQSISRNWPTVCKYIEKLIALDPKERPSADKLLGKCYNHRFHLTKFD